MKKIKVISLCTIFLLLLGIYKFIQYTPEKETVSAKEQVQFSTDLSELKQIKLKHANGELTMQHDSNREDQWKLEDTNEAEIDQSKVYELVSQLTTINISKVIQENPKELATYGLKDPESIMTIVQQNGEEKEYLVGGKLPTRNGYYFMEKGDNIVYSIPSSVGELFHTTRKDILSLATKQVENVEDFKEIIIENSHGEIVIKPYINQSIKHFSKYYLEQPYKTKPQVDVSTEGFQEIVSVFATIPKIEVIEEEAENLKEYGLLDPTVFLKMENMDGTFRSIAMGNENDTGMYYARFDDTNTVYSINMAENRNIFSIAPFDIIYRSPVFTFIYTIQSIHISTSGESYDVEFKKDFNGEQKADLAKAEITYTVNNVRLNEEKMKSFFLSLLELNADAEIDKNLKKGKPEIVMNVIYENEEQVKIEYIPYNHDFYAVYIDNKSDFVIAKDKVSKFIEQIY